MADFRELREGEIEVLKCTSSLSLLPPLKAGCGQREEEGLSPPIVVDSLSSSAIFMEDYESVVTTTPWKVRNSPCRTSEEGADEGVQTVNAVQEFRICVRPMEEDLKDRVSVRIHFK